jgi:ABC-type amino acid transport substrate-binding protein
MVHRIAGMALAAALTLLPAAPSWAADPCADWVPQPKPQNASRDIVGQDIDQIRERGYMTFAVYEDYPPYSWQEGGEARGIDVEIARLIAEDVGVEPRFRFVAAGENLDADLRNNIWQGPIIGGAVSNVMMRVPYDSQFKCRVDQVVFTGQYAAETLAIAYSEALYPEDPPVPAYFRTDQVAVENDSLADFYLSSAFGGQLRGNVRRYPSMAEAMAALAAGEVGAAMGPLAQLEHGLTEGSAVHRPPLLGLSRGTWTLGVAIHTAYRPLGYWVDDAVRYALDDGRIAAIFEAYGLEHLAPER